MKPISYQIGIFLTCIQSAAPSNRVSYYEHVEWIFILPTISTEHKMVLYRRYHYPYLIYPPMRSIIVFLPRGNELK